jgi:cytochrome oxidase assembly protein ShyY1
VPTPLSLPTRSEALHWSYAAQWFIFAAIIPVGVVLLVRRERLDRRRGLDTPAPTPAASGCPPGAGRIAN